MNAAASALQAAKPADQDVNIENARAAMDLAKQELAGCLDFTQTHAENGPPPSTLSPKLGALQVRINDLSGREQKYLTKAPNLWKALDFLRTALHELSQLPEGNEGGARDRLIDNLGQVVSATIAGIDFAIRLSTAKADEITILSAVIGVDPHVRDVTVRVAELLRSPGDSFTVDKPTLEGDDPPPYITRELSIIYRYQGATSLLKVRAGLKVSYEMLVSNASGAVAEAPTARTTPEIQVLSESQMSAIVLIEGDKGVATGFITRVHDTECVVTNLHVLGENQKITIKSLQGKIVSVQGIIGAVGADIALLRLASPADDPPGLEMSDDVFKAVKIGDRVVVVGNRLGGGVATQTSGLVRGIGPDRLEVDAQFKPGNSGSPIFDVANKQVVGVATYTETVALDSFGQPTNAKVSDVTRETRWFGYRLDSVQQWEDIDWTKWRAQIQRVNDFSDASLALLTVYRGQFAAAADKNPRVRSIFEHYGPPSSWSNPALMGAEPLRNLLRAIRAEAESSEKTFAEADYYDYFHSSVYWGTSVTCQRPPKTGQ